MISSFSKLHFFCITAAAASYFPFDSRKKVHKRSSVKAIGIGISRFRENSSLKFPRPCHVALYERFLETQYCLVRPSIFIPKEIFVCEQRLIHSIQFSIHKPAWGFYIYILEPLKIAMYCIWRRSDGKWLGMLCLDLAGKLPSFVTKSLKYQYKEFRGSSLAAPARYGSGDEMSAMLVVSC